MSPKRIVESWVDAFNRADANTLASFYAEDAVNHQVANEPVVGRKAIFDMFLRSLRVPKWSVLLNTYSKTAIGRF